MVPRQRRYHHEHLLATLLILVGACASTPDVEPPSDREVETAFLFALDALPKARYYLRVSRHTPSRSLQRKLLALGHDVVPERLANELRNVYLRSSSKQRIIVVINRSNYPMAMDYTVTLERLGGGRLRVLDYEVMELET